MFTRASVASAGWKVTINAFPPGQVLKEYCRAELMDVVTGVIICTAVESENRIYSPDSLEVLTDLVSLTSV